MHELLEAVLFCTECKKANTTDELLFSRGTFSQIYFNVEENETFLDI